MSITTTGNYTESGATYYDCCDRERFDCETEAEAIHEFIDTELNPRMTAADIEAKIREIGSLKVTAYRREEWSQAKIDMCAEIAAEHVNEHMTDNYGDPDGDPVFDEDELKAAFIKALRTVEPQMWICPESGSRMYEGDDLVAKCREYFPEWFEGRAVSP